MGIALQITATDVSAPIPVIQLRLYLKQKVEQPVTRFSIASSSRHDAQPRTSESRKDPLPQRTVEQYSQVPSGYRRRTAATYRLSNQQT
jgi:hypothetical protein